MFTQKGKKPLVRSTRPPSKLSVYCRAVLMILLGLASQSAMADVIWVGPSADGNCDTNSLPTAVLTAAFSAGDDDIHLADGVDHNNIRLVLNGFDPSTSQGALSIRGGYAFCGDSAPSSGRTTIDGQAGDPIFSIANTTGGVSSVDLVDLVLSGSGARALEVSDGGELSLTNTWVRDNNGGVRVSGNGQFSMESESWIFDNTVSGGFGGGIYCTDDAQVNVGGPVSGNVAGQWGGGIYARGSCQVTLRNKAWIQGNTATVNGGGIAAFSTALITFVPSASTQILIRSNTAQRGGGIYAEGDGTSVLLGNAKIESNRAERGAAIYATQSGFVQVYRTPVENCIRSPRCSSLSFNLLENDIFGAVAWVEQGARVNITNTYIEGNTSAVGRENEISLLTVADSGSLLQVRNTMIWNNQARFIADRFGGGQILMEHVTTAENNYPATSGSNAIGLFTGTDSGSATVTNSLLWGIGSTSGGYGGSCNFASSASVLSDSTESTVIPDPRFADIASGDLRLQPDSDAVDACLAATLTRDIELQDRPADVDNNPNGDFGQAGGRFDAGADEVVETIFADRFEREST